MPIMTHSDEMPTITHVLRDANHGPCSEEMPTMTHSAEMPTIAHVLRRDAHHSRRDDHALQH